MNRTELFVFAGLVLLLVFPAALALLMLEAVRRLRDGGHEQPDPALRKTLLTAGAASLAVGCASLVLGAAELLLEQRVLWAGLGMTAAALLGASGVLLLLVAQCVGRQLSADEAVRLGQRLRVLNRVAAFVLWSYLVVGLFVVPTALSGGVAAVAVVLALFVVFVVATEFLLTAGERGAVRQLQLLTVLSVAMRRGLSLPEEIEAHAEAQTWGLFTPWRPWRILLAPQGLRYAERLRSFADALREGLPLSEALQQHHGLLPSWVVLAVRAGEKTGTTSEALSDVLASLAEQVRPASLATPRGSVLLFYVVGVGLVVLVQLEFVAYFVVPKLKKIYEDFDVPSEVAGRGVSFFFDAADFAVQWAHGIFWLAALLVVLVVLLGRGRWPVLDRLKQRTEMPEVLRTLARLVRRGRSLLDGLSVLVQTVEPGRLKRRLARVSRQARSGTDCWQAMVHAGLLNEDHVGVLTSAQKAGNLPWALDALADQIEEKQAERAQRLLELLRPVAVGVLAVAVGSVAVGVLQFLLAVLESAAVAT